MEEFEKWWKENNKGFASWVINAGEWEAASEVWRAALEWAINNEFVRDKIWNELNKEK